MLWMRREAYAHHTILVRALSTSGHPRHCRVESGITITPGCQTGRGSRWSRRKRVLRLTARSHAGYLVVTSPLRIIVSPRKPSKMPQFNLFWRGQGRGLTHFLLPTRRVGARMALCSVACHWIQSRPIRPHMPAKPKRKRSTKPTPFVGLTHRPHCALCERETVHPTPPAPVPPAPMPPTNRRPRTVDTSRHFCPHTKCDYRGWLGLNNLRANGHPSGGPWRPFHCTACDGSFPEHHGTIFSWQARSGGAHGPRAGVPGGGLGHARHRPGL